MKTVRESIIGEFRLRLVSMNSHFVGIVILNGTKTLQIEGQSADEVWQRLQNEAGKTDPKYFGFDGASARFLHWFRDGFQSKYYQERERKYKVAAKAKLDQIAPLERALTEVGLGPAIWSVFQTNLLSPFEKMRVRDVLFSSEADDFIHAAARFAAGNAEALVEMTRVLRLHASAKWTVITYLPFLWRPECHMYLKPEATRDFAQRVGHRFANDYTPQLEMSVYESLLDLAFDTTTAVTELAPLDRIDIQSLIWVVGDYREGREHPLP